MDSQQYVALSAVVTAVARREDRALMQRFDLLGPLPAACSTTVLEASAGTGKTFALAGLVTRYLAEGVATLDEMLLITRPPCGSESKHCSRFLTRFERVWKCEGR